VHGHIPASHIFRTCCGVRPSISYSHNVLNQNARNVKWWQSHPTRELIKARIQQHWLLMPARGSSSSYSPPSASSLASSNSNIVCLSGLWQNFACHVVIMVPYPFSLPRSPCSLARADPLADIVCLLLGLRWALRVCRSRIFIDIIDTYHRFRLHAFCLSPSQVCISPFQHLIPPQANPDPSQVIPVY